MDDGLKIPAVETLYRDDVNEVEEGVWAVEVDEHNQELRLLADIAVQGQGMALLRVSYQINILVVDKRADQDENGVRYDSGLISGDR